VGQPECQIGVEIDVDHWCRKDESGFQRLEPDPPTPPTIDVLAHERSLKHEEIRMDARYRLLQRDA
jgi:hypothetical protein